MQYKKFILPLTDDGAQEAELNRFLRGHRVVKVDQHFMEADALWALLVCYLDGEQADTAPPARRGSAERFDPARELTEEQLARFRRFSDIRLRLARRDGVKAFVVFTNRELGELARIGEPLTEAMLRKMEGMGDARMEKYGKDFLQQLSEEAELPIYYTANEEGGAPDGADSPA